MKKETKAPRSFAAIDDEARAALIARREALRACPANAMIWRLEAELRELKNRIHAFLNAPPDDPAAEALEAAGLACPPKDQDFGANWFSGAFEKLEEIAKSIEDELGLITCDLPPPAEAATPARKGAAA